LSTGAHLWAREDRFRSSGALTLKGAIGFYKHCIPAGFTNGTMSAILERPARERDLVKAFEVALDKARELKYQLERMKVTFSVADDACTAYFEVVPEPGHLVLGGGLTVKIDLNTKQVIDFERGQ